jgi:pyruvate, water dikinase
MITELIEAEDPARFGGKAAQLSRSLRAGLPVPGGFALDVAAVDAIASGAALAPIDLAPVAVRSSAIGEDGVKASFAGQHATVLGVRTHEEMIAAIKHVHASARTPSARAYRAKMGVDHEPKIAVVIQQMIDADCAGVLFTRHPVTGADERLIEGAWGLGEAVVSGLVDPDRVRMDRSGRVLEHTVGDKPVAVRMTKTGTEEQPLDELRERSCLDAATLRAIAELADQCDRVWSEPHDIEWAMSGGRVWLLQRRPITRSFP